MCQKLIFVCGIIKKVGQCLGPFPHDSHVLSRPFSLYLVLSRFVSLFLILSSIFRFAQSGFFFLHSIFLGYSIISCYVLFLFFGFCSVWFVSLLLVLSRSLSRCFVMFHFVSLLLVLYCNFLCSPVFSCFVSFFLVLPRSFSFCLALSNSVYS